MRLLLFILILIPAIARSATSFTEFYCNSTGTNINAGTTTNATPTYSTTGGAWVQATRTFTKVGADLSAVSVGMFASVFPDGSTTPVFISRITAVDNGADTITLSDTVKTGTAPTDSASGESINVEGAWYGPWYSGATVDNTPFNLVNDLVTNTSLHAVRANLKNDRQYFVTNLVHSSNGVHFEGMTLTPGDGGRVEMFGSSVGAGHVLFTMSGANCNLVNFTLATNGTTSTSVGLSVTATECSFRGLVLRNFRGYGFSANVGCVVYECEATACNQANTAGQGGMLFTTSAGIIAIRVNSHDNTGESSGIVNANVAQFINCIFDSNGRDGILSTSASSTLVSGCDFYNNGSNGVNFTVATATVLHIENSNFIDNGTYGINSTGANLRNGVVYNCGFGTGTAANGSGDVNTSQIGSVNVLGSVSYAANVTPWVDPANGDFDINLEAAKYAGRGGFLPTATLGYPDIGSAQATNAASAGSVVSFPIFRR